MAGSNPLSSLSFLDASVSGFAVFGRAGDSSIACSGALSGGGGLSHD
jgi:hypothetical protein